MIEWKNDPKQVQEELDAAIVYNKNLSDQIEDLEEELEDAEDYVRELKDILAGLE